MAEHHISENEIESQKDHDCRAPSARPHSGRYATWFLGCLVVALIVVVAVLVLNPPLPPQQHEEPVALASPASNPALAPSIPTLAPENMPPSSESTPSPRQDQLSSVRLPEVAISATSDELLQEAERVVERLNQSYPDLPQALHVAALLASRTRHSEEAERLWARCIELAPEGVAYYVNLAAVAMDRGDSQMAASTLRRAVRAGCVSADVYHHLAVALTKSGECEEAEEVITKALELFPNSPASRLVLGQAQLKLGKLAEAEANLRQVVQSGAAPANAYFSLANVCARLGKDEEAAKFREIFTEMKTRAPVDKQQRFEILTTAEARQTIVTILCEAAAVHTQQKNSLESERLLLRAIAFEPANAVPCRLLGELYGNAGMLAEARVVWARLVEIEPYASSNYLALAQVDARLGHLEAAEATLKLLVTMFPEAVDGYAVLAEFHREKGRAGKARWFAQEALRRQPSPEGYEFLASVCRMTGDDAATKAAIASARAMSEKSQRVREGDLPQDPLVNSTADRSP